VLAEAGLESADRVVFVNQNAELQLDPQRSCRHVLAEPLAPTCQVGFVLRIVFGSLVLGRADGTGPREQFIVEDVADDELDPLIDRAESVVALLQDDAGLGIDDKLQRVRLVPRWRELDGPGRASEKRGGADRAGRPGEVVAGERSGARRVSSSVPLPA
jgi:hypothetical protein